MDVKQPVDNTDSGLPVLCPRCDKPVPLDEMDEHQDWHFATDLQEQDGSNAANTAQVAQATSKVAQMNLKTGDNDQSPQSSQYAPPSHPPPANGINGGAVHRPHSNQVIEAGRVRARDEQEMQNALQDLQFRYRIYNSEIEPEHEADYYCACPIHQYQRMKWKRYPVQDMWTKAVIYPGESVQFISRGLFLKTNPVS